VFTVFIYEQVVWTLYEIYILICFNPSSDCLYNVLLNYSCKNETAIKITMLELCEFCFGMDLDLPLVTLVSIL